MKKRYKQEGGYNIAKGKNEPRVNDLIRVARVRLIDEEGNQAGVVSTKDAIDKAEQVGLDLNVFMWAVVLPANELAKFLLNVMGVF